MSNTAFVRFSGVIEVPLEGLPEVDDNSSDSDHEAYSDAFWDRVHDTQMSADLVDLLDQQATVDTKRNYEVLNLCSGYCEGLDYRGVHHYLTLAEKQYHRDQEYIKSPEFQAKMAEFYKSEEYLRSQTA